jgi:ABC-type multidrug transport system ATPase subunit
MKIFLDNISKRFQRHWIIKNVNYAFNAPGSYAILGANGSGKSTLLRIIAGIQSPSAGKLRYENQRGEIPPDKIFNYLSFCAPSQEIVEELTLDEFLKFHYSFKNIYPGLTPHKVVEIIGLEDARHKPIGDYSSGMKQRVKLAQAIFTDSPIVLLDEPCTNLDDEGVLQYRDWIGQYTKDRMVIVASNDVREYFFCREQLHVKDYK